MWPKRKDRVRSGIRDDDGPIRCPGHLKWVRGHACSIDSKCTGTEQHFCQGRIESHHLQSYRAIEGGMGLKVGDDKTVSLCGKAHQDIHMLGHSAFCKLWNVDLERIASDLWKASPHRLSYEQKRR